MKMLVNGLDYCSTEAGLTYRRIRILYDGIIGPTHDEMKIKLNSANAAPRPLPFRVVPHTHTHTHTKKKEEEEEEED